jgi:RNA polymerase sigma-70 factor (ECF subfamily)
MLTKEEKQRINTLVKLLKENNDDALSELYQIMYREIFLSLKKYTNDIHMIEDIVSQTFLSIIEKSQTMIFYTNCYSWILKIARFNFLNTNRKYHKESYIDNEEIFEDYSSKTPTTEELSINSAMNKLSLKDKNFLYLKCYRFLTFKEISKVLHISESTAKRKFEKIKEILKKEINDG